MSSINTKKDILKKIVDELMTSKNGEAMEIVKQKLLSENDNVPVQSALQTIPTILLPPMVDDEAEEEEAEDAEKMDDEDIC
jgi:hypothetical protein